MPRSRTITPPDAAAGAPLELQAPPSKSIALRALVLAATAGGGSVRLGASVPRDVRRLVDALKRLGHPVTNLDDGFRISGPADPVTSSPVSLDVGDGGAPARFLLALAARGRRSVTVDGTPRLRQRPMSPLIEALAALGVEVSGGPGLPVTVRGPFERGGSLALEGGNSSQYCSALLLALPGTGLDVEIALQERQVSAGYVRLTVDVLERFGVVLGDSLHVSGNSRPRPADVIVERDWSAGSALVAAAAFLDRPVRVPGLSLASAQPDRGLVEVLRFMGLTIMESDGAVEVWGSVRRGGRFDLEGMPDAAPALAALAALTEEPVRICGVPHLRLKESDRIETLVALLRAAGVQAEAMPDGLVVRGGGLDRLASASPARIETRGDHRMAMAGALLGLARPVHIDDGDCVDKSFPGFFEQWPGACVLREGPP